MINFEPVKYALINSIKESYYDYYKILSNIKIVTQFPTEINQFIVKLQIYSSLEIQNFGKDVDYIREYELACLDTYCKNNQIACKIWINDIVDFNTHLQKCIHVVYSQFNQDQIVDHEKYIMSNVKEFIYLMFELIDDRNYVDLLISNMCTYKFP